MKTLEQVRDATTPEEMRAEIFRLQFYDYLVKSVMDSADYLGMSAEDRYTVLAYNALKKRAVFEEMAIDSELIKIKQMIIIKQGE